MTHLVSSREEIREIERLLYQEAEYLDHANLDGWIDLYTQDASYWMPVTLDQPDPLNHISLFYDDRTIMEIRRRNFVHPRAPSKDLPVRCSHIISNLQLEEEEQDKPIVVTSNFHCVVYHNEKQTLYAGTYKHELVRLDGQLKIRHKRVDIINSDATLGAMLIYL